MDTEKIAEYAVQYGGKVVVAIIFIFAAFWLAGKVQSALEKRLSARGIDATLSRFAGSAVRWMLLIAALVACLGIFGIETTSFAAVIASAGLAVGLAFQGALSNLAAGVMLILFRPFTAGDVVTAAGSTGKVDAIDLFSTTMDTVDNKRIIVPNSLVFGATIENVTFHDTRRVDVNVGADYGASIDETLTVLKAAAAKCPGILTGEGHEVAAVLVELGGSSVDWQVRVWCNTADYFAVKHDLTREVKMALDAAGIGIPFPQMDVHLDGALAK